MDTRERLVEYRNLLETNPEEAEMVLENCQDERFVSLARLGTDFVDGFRVYLDRLIE